MPATVKVIDLSPKWLKFYELAKDAEPDRRFELWREHYHFAALPPTDRFYPEARRMLDASFHRYPEVLPLIEAGAAGFRPEPTAALETVCRLLEFEGDMLVECILYVGNLEMNAFAYTLNGVPRVNFPLEVDANRELILIHELTHVVHERLCGVTGYPVPLAALAMKEGIAMHAVRALLPGHPDSYYVASDDPSYMDRFSERHREILTGAQPFLAVSNNETMWRFTMGEGTTGLQREVYHVGWQVVGRLLAQGRNLAELARLPEGEIIPLVQQTVAELLA